jgi:hypothetical protein
VVQQILVAIEIALCQIEPVPGLAIGGDGAADVRTAHVEQHVVFFTLVPVSTRMRLMGPLTCVMACVVWSLSQSTVPVVCSTVSHVVFATGTSWRWESLLCRHREHPAAGLSDCQQAAPLATIRQRWECSRRSQPTPTRPPGRTRS